MAEFPDVPRVGDLQNEDPEAFVLHSTAGRLYIIGNRDLGARQGVFILLRRLGYRWFFPHASHRVISLSASEDRPMRTGPHRQPKNTPTQES